MEITIKDMKTEKTYFLIEYSHLIGTYTRKNKEQQFIVMIHKNMPEDILLFSSAWDFPKKEIKKDYINFNEVLNKHFGIHNYQITGTSKGCKFFLNLEILQY